MFAVYLRIINYVKRKKLVGLARFSRRYFRWLAHFFSHNLKMLALIYGSDKWGFHWYAQHYEYHFRSLRRKKLNVLEIGVGGYASPVRGGASLRMWKKFFPKSTIYSIDIYDKSKLQEKRIKIFRGSQADAEFLKDVRAKMGSLDIVIDDGSHLNEHVVTSFRTLFPLLNEGGIYVVEDLQSSYWPSMGGDSDDLDNPNTSMNFFKKLADGLNYKEFLKPGYVPSYFDENISSIHFYHNLIFVYKNRNDEESNVVKNGVLE